MTKSPIPFIAHRLTLPDTAPAPVTGFDADLNTAITEGRVSLRRAHRIQAAREAKARAVAHAEYAEAVANGSTKGSDR